MYTAQVPATLLALTQHCCCLASAAACQRELDDDTSGLLPSEETCHAINAVRELELNAFQRVEFQT